MRAARRRRLYRIAWLAALLAAGCATQYRSYPSRPAAPVNLSGYSEAFRQGYSDGCASSGGAFQRNDQRYRSDADYRMGWDDGNSICRRR